jgi:RNA polymerase sigma factor (sigma-70 family)
MDQRSDPKLIEACLQGDRAAWDELVRRYARLVWSVGRRSGLSAADADDVHQIVFATLVRRLHDLRDRERLSSSLITTTSRECRRLLSRERGRAQADGAGGNAPASPEFGRDEEERQLVRDATDRLDARCRDLLTALFTAAGEPHYPEIAERLGIPIGSIGPTRARCLAKLEALLRAAGLA